MRLLLIKATREMNVCTYYIEKSTVCMYVCIKNLLLMGVKQSLKIKKIFKENKSKKIKKSFQKAAKCKRMGICGFELGINKSPTICSIIYHTKIAFWAVVYKYIPTYVFIHFVCLLKVCYRHSNFNESIYMYSIFAIHYMKVHHTLPLFVWKFCYGCTASIIVWLGGRHPAK